MNSKEELIIGYLPTRRDVFSKEDALKYKIVILNKIRALGYQIVDINDINDEGLIYSEIDIEKIIKKFRSKNVDAIFAPHCNFGTEFAVAKVAKEINKPFLLWGPRDEAPLNTGIRLRDSQCGLFATSKILQRLNIPFTYIINSRIEDEIFKRGFKNFVKAANVVKVFNKIKIGQIGVRPQPFWSVIYNEGELLEKFKIEVIPFNLVDIVFEVKKILSNPDSEFYQNINFIKENISIEFEDDDLKKIFALKIALKKISIEQNISAFAIQCWDTLQELIGIFPCFANALLFDEKIPVACETDVLGAVTSLITQAATFNEKPVFFADITNRHPKDENKELLWHCGSFPYSLKKNNLKGSVSKNFLSPFEYPGTCNWEIKGGDISISRLDTINGKYFLFIGHAKGTTGPETKGTYLWIKVKNWKKWEEKLIYGPYIHHVACIHSKIAPVLYEAVKYINNVELDLIEPTEKEVKDWLYS